MGTHPCQQRLALEEMLAHHLSLRRVRERSRKENAFALPVPAAERTRFLAGLGFDLTQGQRDTLTDIDTDLAMPHPMMRLVQGDVGCGKTVVAAAAAITAMSAGYQVAVMAPTELLAEQHRQTFSQWFGLLGVHTEWLTGKLPAAKRRAALENIKSGDAKMVVGTHALFQDQVEFRRLGLLVIDEQHRFGVDQRLALHAKGRTVEQSPHQIIMSATPIPRSLAMILYADLDISSIDELPPGRKAVTTVVLPSSRRTEVAERIRSICESGQQAYWVCPLIDESEKLQAQAATEIHAILKSQLPTLNIELIHGRLKSRVKEEIMERFNRGTIALLVSTTVIEVGVDVPNASLMIIENAERLGLAQLHQLRGRVGRGAAQASCILMYDQPLGALARERLGILRDTNDGFEIARKDLEHRGPGELLGTRQTGLQQLKIANLSRDKGLIPVVDNIAQSIEKQHPALVDPLVARWLPSGEQYSKV
jgi:ATP-dependent DNA helicase RecG